MLFEIMLRKIDFYFFLMVVVTKDVFILIFFPVATSLIMVIHTLGFPTPLIMLLVRFSQSWYSYDVG
jgi:hypothetical protein